MRLSNNPTSMRTDLHNVQASERCPTALAWMASLALAAGDHVAAEHWLREVVAALVFNRAAGATRATVTPAPQDTTRMS